MYNKQEDAGKMRHRIRLLNYLPARDEYGDEVRRWIASDYIWAQVLQRIAGSKEDEIAGRYASLTDTIIKTRYRSTVNASMRVLWGNKVFSIENVIPDVREMYMELKTTQDEPQQLDRWSDENDLWWEDENGDAWQWDSIADDNNDISEGESFTDEAGLIWTKQ
jgi:SPP1 family predicted phage head-tail adaptor